jgi:hypothetical protein
MHAGVPRPRAKAIDQSSVPFSRNFASARLGLLQIRGLLHAQDRFSPRDWISLYATTSTRQGHELLAEVNNGYRR